MDDLRLRTSTGDDVGVELQDYGGDDEPLWAVRAEKLLTTAELLALADAIRERYGAGASTQEVTGALVEPPLRHYTCHCGADIETMWPGGRVACPACEATYCEVGDVLRKLGSGDVIEQNKVQT